MKVLATSPFEHSGDKTIVTKLIGWSFVTMFLLGIFAEFVVRTRLIIWHDPVLTYTTIQQSLPLFTSGIFAFIFIILLDMLLSIAFYVLLHSQSKPVALLMASLRLVYVAIKGFAIVGLFLAKDIYSSSMHTNRDQIHLAANQAMQFLKLHQYGFAVGLIFFGLHLMFLARLLFTIPVIPKVLSWLLLLAGIGYSLNSLVSLFATNLELLKNSIIAIFILPMTLAELLVGLYLWLKAKKVILLLK
ncbi:DUF4386 domain-containing protein [Rhodocytophaga aerolata]|uniref:DUF4386 domain-containing protein n=1 Tax=Rhodocytophaga aerolata TaxID=455078 RepID=A0ABT8RCA4_9BACT|nr:DUF4386 domain-containing protein [Rhodocytophaga aerolata]MDO1449736.1 DUF4386 domain-containing protein [Rhodocytophaga aerolata]